MNTEIYCKVSCRQLCGRPQATFMSLLSRFVRLWCFNKLKIKRKLTCLKMKITAASRSRVRMCTCANRVERMWWNADGSMLGPPTRRLWSQAPSSANNTRGSSSDLLSREAILPIRPSCLRTIRPRRGARENLRAGGRPQIKVVVEREAGKGCKPSLRGSSPGSKNWV